MQLYYGENNLLRALDEAEFWKHQEAEHTAVIRLVTPGLESGYVSALEEFAAGFDEARENVTKYIQDALSSDTAPDEALKLEMLEYVKYCVCQSKEFEAFLEDVLENSGALKDGGAPQIVIHHIIRESRYFIGIEQTLGEHGAE